MVRTQFFKRHQKDVLKNNTLHVFKVSENGIAHISVNYSTYNIIMDDGKPVGPEARDFKDAEEISEHEWFEHRDKVVAAIDSI